MTDSAQSLERVAQRIWASPDKDTVRALHAVFEVTRLHAYCVYPGDESAVMAEVLKRLEGK
jgi:hypothetical protein